MTIDNLIVRGLTLYQPWAHAVAQGHKKVENRKWAPPKAWIGQTNVWIAIHAGKTYDLVGETKLKEWGVAHPPEDKLDYAAILGVGRLAAVVTKSSDPMFFGPYGWVLDHLVPLKEPIPVKGAMGVWGLTPEHDAIVRAHIASIPKGPMLPVSAGQSQADLFRF